LFAAVGGQNPGDEQMQDLRVRAKTGVVEDHGEAKPADPAQDGGVGVGNARRANGEVKEFLDELDALENFAEGDLTDEERARLADKARVKLERDMLRLQERERSNARDSDPKEAAEIRQDRYRASLRALERDLIQRVANLRRPGGDKYESTLDDLDDRVRETFADLHDRLDEGGAKLWAQVLEDGRKFHAQYSVDVEKWGKEIGVNAPVMDIPRRITEIKKQLRARLVKIRKRGGNKIEDQMDDLEEKILASYEALEDKVDDTAPAHWPDLMASAEKFFVQYSSEMDKWAKEAGIDEAKPSPIETVDELREDLLERVAQLRRLAGDRHEGEIDKLEDAIRDTFADLRERILSEDKKAWNNLRNEAERHYKVFTDSINVWQRRIELGTSSRSRDQDAKLPPGEHMDVIEGVRVARLAPLPRKQLGLDNGLSVNEIVDASRALGRAGLQVHDIIVEVNGSAVDSRMELRNAVNGIERGKEFTIKVMRDGKAKELKATR
jgi:hypothetical protein